MAIVKIEGLNPLEYEHPLDKKGLDTLEKTPGLDFLVQKFYELGWQKYLQLLVSGIITDLTFGVNLTTPVMRTLNLALWQWYRWSEFTADRAGLLACQDLKTAMGAMAKIAGLPRKYFDSFDIDDFVTQAREYKGLGETSYAKLIKVFSSMSRNQAFTISRANELLKWFDSGEYQAVLERKTRIKPAPQAAPQASFCRHCGFKLEPSNAFFCSNCGKRVSA